MPKKSGDKYEEVSKTAPATITVSLPANAKLFIDDAATTSTSEKRVFTSPVLTAGKEYSYTLRAELVRDGKTLTATKRIAVRAGEETPVTFEFAVASVASR